MDLNLGGRVWGGDDASSKSPFLSVPTFSFPVSLFVLTLQMQPLHLVAGARERLIIWEKMNTSAPSGV